MANFIQSLGKLDFRSLLTIACVSIIAILILGIIARLIFGKRSTLGCSVSSAIAVLFIYALSLVLRCTGSIFEPLCAPLPFLDIQNGVLLITGFRSGFAALCAELTSLITLALIVSLIDTWMPSGKKLTWILFRFLTVVAGLVAHVIVVSLLQKYLSFLSFAPMIILGILLLMTVSALLKVVLITTNPIIGLLYTFFFSNVVGKQIFKAVLTTALLSGLLLLMNTFGISAILITAGGLVAYIPFALALMGLWYVSNKLF